MSTTAEASQVDGEITDVLYKEEYKPWFWPLVIPLPPLYFLMWKYHVIITDDDLSFGYSSVYTSKRVTNRHATIKEITPLFDQKWSGWGIHYRLDPVHSFFGAWERLYICNNGGAVKMVVWDDKEGLGDESGTTTFYFSTNDPQKVCDILTKKA